MMAMVYNKEWVQSAKDMHLRLRRQGGYSRGRDGIEICPANERYIVGVARLMQGTTTSDKIVLVKVKS